MVALAKAGKSNAEIAAALGTTAKIVSVYLSQARARGELPRPVLRTKKQEAATEGSGPGNTPEPDSERAPAPTGSSIWKYPKPKRESDDITGADITKRYVEHFLNAAGRQVAANCQPKYAVIGMGCVANLLWGQYPDRVLVRIDDDGNVQWFDIGEMRAAHTKMRRLLPDRVPG